MDWTITIPVVPAAIALVAFFVMMVVGCSEEGCGFIPWISLLACVIAYFFVSGLFVVFV